MDLILDTMSWFCLLAGGFFVLSGGIGILRLPDFFTRLHGASVTDTMGAGLIVLGLLFQAGLTMAGIKLVLILLFMLFTSPTSTHALAKAAVHGGLTPILHHAREEQSSKN